MDVNKILNNYPTDKEIDVICVENIHGLTFGKRYKASLINSAFLPLHWEVNDTLCALEYLIPLAEWRNQQIDKIVTT
jgi:hypothetical protein